MTAHLFLNAIISQAESAYKDKDWKKACKHYDSYFTKAYKEKKNPEDPDKEITLEDALRLCHYAESLFEQMKSESTNSKFDQDDIETVVEYLLSARNTFSKHSDESTFPLDKYIDTYDLLGQISLYINQFKRAQKQFDKGFQKAIEKGCSWRIRLSLLVNKATALEMQEKPRQAIKTIEDGLKIIEEEVAKKPDEDQLALMNEFKESLQNKITELQGDIKEQDENKDTLKENEEEEE